MIRFVLTLGLSLALSAALLTSCASSGGGAASSLPMSAASSASSLPMPASSSASAADGTYQTITAEEGKAMMDAGGVTVVDVRTQKEYDAGHIPDAILVPNESIGEEPPEALPDKSAALLIYCRTGIRAADASEKLAKMGYTNVYDMGGIRDWPYETVSAQGEASGS